MNNMIINQLSVFLENKSGRLGEVLNILSRANIRIVAATVADTSEYGILRLVTSDTSKAFELLKQEKVSVHMSEVIALACNPLAGNFAEKLSQFSKNGLSIEYMYCFSVQSTSFLIIRTNDKEKMIQVVNDNNLPYITESDLIAM